MHIQFTDNAFQMDSDIDESLDNLVSVLALGKAGDAEFVPGEEHLSSQFVNESDYQGEKLVTSAAVPGNIHAVKYRSFRSDFLKPSEMTMATISRGDGLPFHAIPPKTDVFKNNKSARLDDTFVRAEIDRLQIELHFSGVRASSSSSSSLEVLSKRKRLVVDGSRQSYWLAECWLTATYNHRFRITDLVRNVIKFWMLNIRI